jgi:hypothetical protein
MTPRFRRRFNGQSVEAACAAVGPLRPEEPLSKRFSLRPSIVFPIEHALEHLHGFRLRERRFEAARLEHLLKMCPIRLRTPVLLGHDGDGWPSVLSLTAHPAIPLQVATRRRMQAGSHPATPHPDPGMV